MNHLSILVVAPKVNPPPVTSMGDYEGTIFAPQPFKVGVPTAIDVIGTAIRPCSESARSQGALGRHRNGDLPAQGERRDVDETQLDPDDPPDAHPDVDRSDHERSGGRYHADYVGRR